MSHQLHNEHEGISFDTLPPSDHELHAKAQEYEHDYDSMGSPASKVQQAIPKHLPWYGVAEANSSSADITDTQQNMDAVPIEYQLHSNTKTHQRGGVYESFSALG